MRRSVVLGALAIAAVAMGAAIASSASPQSTAPTVPAGDFGSGIASSTDGPFDLVLSLSGTSFTTDQVITGQASLSVTDGEEATIAGPGAGPLAFSFNEVGGTRRMGPGYRLSCGLFTIEPGSAMTSDLAKSGGWTAEDPNASFYRSSFADPDIHLPPGTWDIAARASFSDNECGGPSHDLTATLRVVVTP